MVHEEWEQGPKFVPSESAWSSEPGDALTEVRVELPSTGEEGERESPERTEQRDEGSTGSVGCRKG